MIARCFTKPWDRQYSGARDFATLERGVDKGIYSEECETERWSIPGQGSAGCLLDMKRFYDSDQQHLEATEEGARQLPVAAEGARGSAGSPDQAQATTGEGARQIPAAAEGARGSAGSSNEARRTLEFVVARSWKELVPRRSELIVA